MLFRKQQRKTLLVSWELLQKKIAVVPLGVTSPQVSSDEVRLHKYIDTGWGYAKRPFKLDDTPYLLFIGGVDSRRKLEDLVAAFNNLRAKGNHLRLILAGDIMLGPSAITNKVVADSLAKSSYLDDIVFMGFIDDSQKYLLYEKALAYVFPSRYEGFGLPILEAMIHGCPVISYKSQAVAEVGGDFPVYADNLKELEQAIVNLLQVTKSAAKERARRYVKVAEGYSWQRTATGILKVIYNSK